MIVAGAIKINLIGTKRKFKKRRMIIPPTQGFCKFLDIIPTREDHIRNHFHPSIGECFGGGWLCWVGVLGS